MMLLNFGCGSIQPGMPWVNVDAVDHGQDHVVDICDRLPFPDDCFAGAVASHSLQEIPYDLLPAALAELRRVLQPGARLRTLSPNPLSAFAAYVRGDIGWFPIGDDEPTLDGKASCYLTWFGRSRNVFTPGRMVELLEGVGFIEVCSMPFAKSRSQGLADLDSRESEQQTIVEGAVPK